MFGPAGRFATAQCEIFNTDGIKSKSKPGRSERRLPGMEARAREIPQNTRFHVQLTHRNIMAAAW